MTAETKKKKRTRWAVLFFADGQPVYASDRAGKLAWSYDKAEAEQKAETVGDYGRVVDADDFAANPGKYLRAMKREARKWLR